MAKFVRYFLTVVFFMLFSVVSHAQVIGSGADIVALHAANISPTHISECEAMLSRHARHTEIMGLNTTSFSPRFDMTVVRGSKRFILPGCEEEEVEVAVSIEVRGRGPP